MPEQVIDHNIVQPALSDGRLWVPPHAITPIGTTVLTRAAANDWHWLQSASQTVHYLFEIQALLRRTAVSGLRIDSIDLMFQPLTNALTSITPALATVTHLNGVRQRRCGARRQHHLDAQRARRGRRAAGGRQRCPGDAGLRHRLPGARESGGRDRDAGELHLPRVRRRLQRHVLALEHPHAGRSAPPTEEGHVPISQEFNGQIGDFRPETAPCAGLRRGLRAPVWRAQHRDRPQGCCGEHRRSAGVRPGL